MADALQHAINDSRRVPNIVLTGHVHNFQRIERSLVDGGPTPFIVAGNGGYFHLHGMHAEDGTTDDTTGAHLIASNHKDHGYLTLSVDAQNITGSLTTVSEADDTVTHDVDTFSYPATGLHLADGVMVSL